VNACVFFGATNVNAPTSTTNSVSDAQLPFCELFSSDKFGMEKFTRGGSGVHQQRRYTPPVDVTTVLPQLTSGKALGSALIFKLLAFPELVLGKPRASQPPPPLGKLALVSLAPHVARTVTR
jgi:hypothetical protein